MQRLGFIAITILLWSGCGGNAGGAPDAGVALDGGIETDAAVTTEASPRAELIGGGQLRGGTLVMDVQIGHPIAHTPSRADDVVVAPTAAIHP